MSSPSAKVVTRGQRLALAGLVIGALAIAFSPIFVRLSEVGPTATGFYRRLGFTARGDVFMDAGIPHVEMILRFAPPSVQVETPAASV